MSDSAADIAAQIRELVAKAAVGLTLEVTANLREACPVDTGNARARFIPHVGDDDPGSYEAGAAAVVAYKIGDGPLNITNDAPYLPFLIGGSSSQAPAGWDVTAIDEAIQTTQQQYDVRIEVTRDTASEPAP